MAYAILRFAKRKGVLLRPLLPTMSDKGSLRQQSDVDKSRTAERHLIAPRWSYGQEIRHRIGMAGLPGAPRQPMEICGDLDYDQPGVCKKA